MRKTSYKITAIVGCFIGACVLHSAEIQDLGLSQIESVDYVKSNNETLNYTEIFPESWEGRAMSAAEILSTLPGIQYYSQGGLGSFQTISVRGIAARSIIICIDGIPLNDASGGAVNLGMIDLNQIEKIEVYKDYVPMKFGGSGVGGVVNFITKGKDIHINPQKKASGRVLASYGTHNSLESQIQVNANIIDSVIFFASLSSRHSDNDYEFNNRNGTPYNKEDDFTDKRKNAQFTENSGIFKAKILHSNGVFSNFSGHIDFSKGGNPGREDYQTTLAGYEGEQTSLYYQGELPQFFGWLWLDLGLSYQFEKAVSHSYYPLDHIGYFSSEFLEYGAAGYNLKPEITGSYFGKYLDVMLRLSATSNYYEGRGTSRDWNLSRYGINPSGEFTFHGFHYVTLMANGIVQFLKDDIHGGKFVLPTMSTQLKTAKSREISYSLRGTLLLGNKEKNKNSFFDYVNTKFSVGRYFREPQLMELYGVYPGMVSNPDLLEETALRVDASLSIKSPSRLSTFTASYYETYLKNGIVWLVSGAFMKPANVFESYIQGLEGELESNPVNFLRVILRGTFQNALDKSDSKSYNNKKIPGEPAQAYYAEARIQLPFNFDFTWSSEYRTKIFSDRANRIEQPECSRHNASIGVNPFEKTRFIFAIENITDETYRNIYTPYPTPGREYKLTYLQGF